MAAVFPSSPTNGQTAVVGNRYYTWNATNNVWENTGAATGSATIADLTVTGNSALSATTVTGNVNITGNVSLVGTMTGTINIADANVTGTATIATMNVTGTGTIATLTATTITSPTNTNLTINPNGTGLIVVTDNLVPNANATLALGSTSLRFANIWGVASSALYADLAENYESDQHYDRGTVVIFAGSAEITASTGEYDTRIAGVISDKPAYLMNDGGGDLHLPVALTGKVECWVEGPISKGDVLVSGSSIGTAQRIDKSRYLPGCVIGKSLEDSDLADRRLIMISVGRF